MKYICPICGEIAITSGCSIGTDHRMTIFKRNPEPGALTLCRNCTEILQFDEAMDLVLPSLKTLMLLTPQQSKLIEHVTKRFKAMRGNMPKHTTGERVGCILSADLPRGEALLLGYGVYEGDFVPPPEINPEINDGELNPRIRLDNGKVVWGCECWWSKEADTREILKPFRRVINVDIEEVRNECYKPQNERSKGTPATLDSYEGAARWRWKK